MIKKAKFLLEVETEVHMDRVDPEYEHDAKTLGESLRVYADHNHDQFDTCIYCNEACEVMTRVVSFEELPDKTS